jgi:hypothetical protein
MSGDNVYNTRTARKQAKTLRRKVQKAILKLIDKDGDHCTVCGRTFSHYDRTWGGVTCDNRIADVGECCLNKMQWLYCAGVYLAPKAPTKN